MNTPSPLVPQGTILEQRNKGRARVKIAVFVVLAIHGIGLLALLMQGCKKEPDAGANAGAEQTNATNLAQAFAEPTNTPVASNAGSMQTNLNAPAEALSSTSSTAVPPAPIAPAVPGDYKVQRGDTFATIAKKFHVTVKGIEAANQGVDPTKLQIGQTLHIPAPAVAAAPGGTGSTAVSTAADSAAGQQNYTVKSGDTLIGIATNYHVSVKALRTANSLTTDKIKVGQKLTIPSRTSTTAPNTGALTSAAPSSATTPLGQ
jgi:LysM repeat protein